jgi:hypothetical protein
MSPTTVWEAMKAYLRGQIISYSAIKEVQYSTPRRIYKKILDLDMAYSHSPSADLLK